MSKFIKTNINIISLTKRKKIDVLKNIPEISFDLV